MSARRLVGYAIVFEQLYRRGDGSEEMIRYGACRDAIRRGNLDLLVNHDLDQPIATQVDGSLRLTEDHHGVRIEADVRDDCWQRRAVLANAAQFQFGGSFGFRTCCDELTAPPRRARILTRVDLTHLSVVHRDRAAYRGTWIVRDSDDARRRLQACEREAVQRRLEEAVAC